MISSYFSKEKSVRRNLEVMKEDITKEIRIPMEGGGGRCGLIELMYVGFYYSGGTLDEYSFA